MIANLEDALGGEEMQAALLDARRTLALLCVVSCCRWSVGDGLLTSLLACCRAPTGAGHWGWMALAPRRSPCGSLLAPVPHPWLVRTSSRHRA